MNDGLYSSVRQPVDESRTKPCGKLQADIATPCSALPTACRSLAPEGTASAGTAEPLE